MALVWLNGRLVADEGPCLSAFDRGLTLADGVFETMRAHGVQPLWLEEHLARLRAGAGCPSAFRCRSTMRRSRRAWRGSWRRRAASAVSSA